jgi:hypothetical protein
MLETLFLLCRQQIMQVGDLIPKYPAPEKVPEVTVYTNHYFFKIARVFPGGHPSIAAQSCLWVDYT